MLQNTLFQSIQVLEGHLSKYNSFVEDHLEESPLSSLAAVLKPILGSQKSILYEMERQIAAKVDRLEFS